MKSVDWGNLYDNFKDEMFDTKKIEEEIRNLMMDDDVTNQKGIYGYVLTRDEKYLNIRGFSERQKHSVYEKQQGICIKCEKHFEFEQMQGDHIIPWSKGGKTNDENCQMLCQRCNGQKSSN